MNIQILFTGLVILAICIIPFVLMGIYKKKKAQQLLNDLYGFATKHHCIISEYESGGDYIIGLDNVKKVLFFYKNAHHHTMIEKLELAQVKHCRSVTSVAEIKSEDGTKKTTDSIELVFGMKAENKPEVRWTLFDTLNDMVMIEEHQLAERWAAKVKQLLKA